MSSGLVSESYSPPLAGVIRGYPYTKLVGVAGIEPATFPIRGGHAPAALHSELAAHTGFEPVISTVTGWRPLQTGPMNHFRVVCSDGWGRTNSATTLASG